MSETQMVTITVDNSMLEFLGSIFSATPMKTVAEIDVNLRAYEATKESLDAFADKRQALFNEFAVLVPRGSAGKGGGKVKRNEMVPQVPDERKDEYQSRFLKIVAETVALQFTKQDAEQIAKWIQPEWLINRVERFVTAQGIDSITHQKVLMKTALAFRDAGVQA